jgi:hypothetical protein
MRTRNVMLLCLKQYFLTKLIPTESFRYQVLPFPNYLAENARECGDPVPQRGVTIHR